jgi:HEAT repeat protein
VRAVEPLGRILTASDDSAEVRQAAAAGLEELKDQRAVPFLLVALGDESLHNFAWNTLARLVGIAEADRLTALADGD